MIFVTFHDIVNASMVNMNSAKGSINALLETFRGLQK